MDARNVDVALGRHNPPAAIREVCDLLSNDAQTGVGNLPTPDQQLTDELNTAFVDATAAGDDCYNGAGGQCRAALPVRRPSGPVWPPCSASPSSASSPSPGRTPTTETTAPPDDGDPFAGT